MHHWLIHLHTCLHAYTCVCVFFVCVCLRMCTLHVCASYIEHGLDIYPSVSILSMSTWKRKATQSCASSFVPCTECATISHLVCCPVTLFGERREERKEVICKTGSGTTLVHDLYWRSTIASAIVHVLNCRVMSFNIDYNYVHSTLICLAA